MVWLVNIAKISIFLLILSFYWSIGRDDSKTILANHELEGMECCKVYTEKNSSCKPIPYHSFIPQIHSLIFREKKVYS